MQKHSYHHGNLKEALLNAAELLIAQGSSDLSLRSVARIAGVSHSAPYRHFKSWEDIQWHLQQRVLDSIHKEIKKLLIGELAAARKIKIFAKKIIEIAIIEPQKFAALSLAVTPSAAPSAAAGEEVFKVLVKLVVQHLHEEECRQQNDAFQIASTLWCAFFGIAHLAHSGWIPFDKKSIYGEKLLSGSLETILPKAE